MPYYLDFLSGSLILHLEGSAIASMLAGIMILVSPTTYILLSTDESFIIRVGRRLAIGLYRQK